MSTKRDDRWLDDWLTLMAGHAAGRPVLELGCGSGRDSRYLSNNGFSILALDISAASLAECVRIGRCLPVCADVSRPLPFRDSTFGVVVASLCLHYFSWQDTRRIVGELRRVLEPNGMLLVRVNAYDDFNFGACKGVEIEQNYYLYEGRKKRFFDRDSVDSLLKDFDVKSLHHKEIDRYQNSKMVWEAHAIAAPTGRGQDK